MKEIIFRVWLKGIHISTQKACQLEFLVIAPEDSTEKDLMKIIKTDMDIGGIKTIAVSFMPKRCNKVISVISKFI